MTGSVDEHNLVIVYDGKCPFCNNYVRLMALKEVAGSVELIDARSAHPLVLRLESLGYVFDDGMAALYGGKIYYGPDAVILISTMARGDRRTAKVLAWLLASPTRAKFLYPIMKFGRRITLWLLGIGNIRQERGVVQRIEPINPNRTA
jgi:predicted DCC family thiol-disulfide oxidoreductase YuxK